jgi:hypothetical protein
LRPCGFIIPPQAKKRKQVFKNLSIKERKPPDRHFFFPGMSPADAGQKEVKNK